MNILVVKYDLCFVGLVGYLCIVILVDFVFVGYVNMGIYDILFKDWEF